MGEVGRRGAARAGVVSGALPGTRHLALALFVLVLGVYLLGYRGATAGDDLIHLQACDALVTRGTLGFPVSEYDPARQPLVRFFFRRGVNGEMYGALPPGLPVVSAPLCAAARWLAGPSAGAIVGSARFVGPPRVPLSRLRTDPEAFAAGLVNPLACAAVVLLFFLYARLEGVDPRWAVTAALCLALGTYLWVYAESYWTEPLCLLSLFGGFLALRRAVEGPPSAIPGVLGGALLGAAALFRYDASAFGAALLAVACVLAARRRGARAMVAPVAGWLGPIAVLAWWNWHRFGSVLQTGNPHGHLKMLFGAHVLDHLGLALVANLVSLNQGLLVFAPPVAVAAWITARAFRRLNAWERTAALFAAALVVFYSAFLFWETAQSWGPRFLVLVVPFALVPVLRHGTAAARRWLVGSACLGAVVQLGGVLTVMRGATIRATMRSFVPGTLHFLLSSEVRLAWAHLATRGPDALWWSRSAGAGVAATLIGLGTLAAGVALLTRFRAAVTPTT